MGGTDDAISSGMHPKITLAGLILTLACGLIIFARYSLDAIFAGGFCSNPENDFLNANFTPLVIGSAALLGSVATAFKRTHSRTVTSRTWYRFAT